ncbi:MULTISPECIES: peptidylprolyl isomerase [Colwellia]|jgi:peptidylprolyl isomerase|uniref:peptidylprolyl isomerase n=1 Tax=Colwellia psychrerythraea (strain 34H / ATCC BAA-681) TaxID=167879 RepID=Q47UB6_COLP3|nr:MULTISPECIES: peptidylprolyl isomerase [Colwellia]AAZ24607.1 peptidyl-prolyl cis-trans isomerase, cyclophilin-type [Colwellia psychrerythraea 34H]
MIAFNLLKIDNPAMTASLKSILTLTTLFFINACGADNSADSVWRELSLNNTVLLTLPHGKVVIELAPQFSPIHVAQFSQLTQQGFYDQTSFYRVIDGFVAQAGPKDGSKKDRSVPLLAMEAEWQTDKKWTYTSVQENDLFAEQTGFKDSFALGYQASNDGNTGKAWLTHCPGTVAMARNNEADSASSHFYFVIGQAPRYLDRIMTIFGRVVYGMQHIQAIQRTEVVKGDYAVDHRDFTKIVSMQLMSDVTKADQIHIEVENTESTNFADRLVKRRARDSAFFYKKPPPVLDVCQIPIRSRRVK